jgi:hypothetical protein
VFGQATNLDGVLAIRKGTRITKLSILP